MNYKCVNSFSFYMKPMSSCSIAYKTLNLFYKISFTSTKYVIYSVPVCDDVWNKFTD